MSVRCSYLGMILTIAVSGSSAGCCGSDSPMNVVHEMKERSEAAIDVDDIRTEQLRYFAEHGEYLDLPRCPEAIPGTNSAEFSAACIDSWAPLGWMPEQPVWCQYWAVASNTESPTVEIYAECDLDGDGLVAQYMADRDNSATLQTHIDEY